MSVIWQRGEVYPYASIGEYQTVCDPIVEVGEPLGDSISVTIEHPKYGRITGYAAKPFIPLVPKAVWACMHVYAAGGGWYPDNHVTYLSANPKEVGEYKT